MKFPIAPARATFFLNSRSSGCETAMAFDKSYLLIYLVTAFTVGIIRDGCTRSSTPVVVTPLTIMSREYLREVTHHSCLRYLHLYSLAAASHHNARHFST